MSKAWKDTNDVVYDVARRAAELADETMDYLRERAATYYGEPRSLTSIREQFRGWSRGELISEILTKDSTCLIEDYPRAIEPK